VSRRRGRVGRALVVAFAFGAALAGPAAAADPSPEQLVRESRQAGGLHHRGAEARVRLVITTPGRAPRERRLHSYSREEAGLGRSLVRFESPPDVAGTAYLWRENRGRDDDHWLYRPELRRARRITGAQKRESFMGTNFSYADLEWRDPATRRHRRLPDEKLGGAPCFVIESTAKEASDPYGRVVSWIRKEGRVPLRVKLYGRDGAHLKTLFTKKVQKISGHWVVTQARMSSATDGSATDLVVDAIEYKDLPAALFDPRALEKG
jgi:hypothetical protein